MSPDRGPETDSDVTGSDTDTINTVSGDGSSHEPADDPEEDRLMTTCLAEAMRFPRGLSEPR